MAAARSYLAGHPTANIPLLVAALLSFGYPSPTIAAAISVTELAREGPALLVLDLDRVVTDPIELLRRLRFVLPLSIIAVYTSTLERDWARACHVAGANCLLSKSGDAAQIGAGLRDAIVSGAHTDLDFARASVA
jgi:DNA-binding NarL/FixJ family response regulator